VVTNAVSVDNNGTIMYRAAEHTSELPAQELIENLAALPNVKLVVSLRGYPDDVALDELAEVDSVRTRFTTDAAISLRGWNASGLEIEWHSDDPVGGKAIAAPFDVMEQYHFALLCRDLSSSLRAAGGKTLSVAVRPGRQEFADGNFVRGYINWLTLRAYSMRSLGDPHHASLKDMEQSLDEWHSRGVPKSQLVLGTPLFARPGAALHSAGDRNEDLRQSWGELARSTALLQQKGSGTSVDQKGDRFRDAETGKVWWVSGVNTTQAKVQHVLEHGYGGVALRDLHLDSSEPGLSLVQAAKGAAKEFQRRLAVQAQARKQRRPMAAVQAPALFQRGSMLSKTDPTRAGIGGDGDKHDEF